MVFPEGMQIYLDAAKTQPAAMVRRGQTVYIESAILENISTALSRVVVQAFDETYTLKAAIMDTGAAVDFVANITLHLSDLTGGGAPPTLTITTAFPDGIYYILLTLSGAGIETQYLRISFHVLGNYISSTGEPTLSDGSITIKLYATDAPETEFPLKVAIKEMPFRDTDVHQFLGRGNDRYTYSGFIFPDESSAAIVAQLESWAKAGTGIATGTLTLVNNAGSHDVYISGFKFTELVGFPPDTYNYMLELTEPTVETI